MKNTMAWLGLASALAALAGCGLPSETRPSFSLRNEILRFSPDGNFLGRSQAVRGAPRDLEWLPDGRVLVAADGGGLTFYDPEADSFGPYFGPVYMSEADYVAGREVKGARPEFMTVWFRDHALKLLDARGEAIESVPIPEGCNDADLLDNGNILLTHSGGNRIVEITPDGDEVWSSGLPLRNPIAVIPLPDGEMIISDFDNHRVIRATRDNRVVFEAEGLNHPRDIDLLADGNILTADSDLRRVIAIQPPGGIHVLAGRLNRPLSVAFNPHVSILLVGVEAFFQPGEDDKIQDISVVRLKIFLIWLGAAVASLAAFLAWRRWGASLSAWTEAQRARLSGAIGRHHPWMLMSAAALSVPACFLIARQWTAAGPALLALSIAMALAARRSSALWLSPFPPEEAGGESPPAVARPGLVLAGVLAVLLAFLWSRACPRDLWIAVPWAAGTLAAVMGFGKRAPSACSGMDWIFGIFVLAVALFFRLYRLDGIPYGLWMDETFAVWRAVEGFERGTLEPFRTTPLVNPNEFEVTDMYLLAVLGLFKIFTPSFSLVKMISVIPSLGIVLGVHQLGRWTMGKWAGRLAALMIAMNAWQLMFARWGWLQQLYVCLAVFALAYFVRALRWRCPRSAAWCGLFVGLGLYTYVPIALTIAALVLIALMALADHNRTAALKIALTAAFTALLVFSPLWAHFLDNPGVFFARARRVGIMHEMANAGSLEPLRQNLLKYGLMFHVQGDFNPRHNIPDEPLLDPLTGGLFALGLALCLRFAFRPSERALLTAFAMAMAGGALSAPVEAPNSFRTGLAGPLVCLFAALPLASLLERRREGKDAGPPAKWASVFAAAMVAMLLVVNFNRYFVRYPNKDTWIASLSPAPHLVFTHLERGDLGARRLYIHPSIANTTMNLYTWLLAHGGGEGEAPKLLQQRFTIADLSVRLPQGPPRALTLVTPPGQEELVRKHFPNARVEILHNPYGEPKALVARVPPPGEPAN